MPSNVNDPLLGLAKARQLKANFWNLRAAPWGDLFKLPTDPEVQRIGPLNLSILGAQIAADSKIDRCVIQYAPGGRVFPPTPVANLADRQDLLILSKDRPLMQPMPGPISFIVRKGDFYSTDPAVVLGVPVGGYVQQDGTHVSFPTALLGELEQTLSVNLILRDPLQSLYGDRDDIGEFKKPTVLTGGGVEDTLMIVPVSSRKRIRVSLFSPAAGPALTNWRLSGLVGDFDFGVLLPQNRLHEIPLLDGGALAPGTTETLELSNPEIRWIMLKATTAAVGPPLTVFHWMTASDE